MTLQAQIAEIVARHRAGLVASAVKRGRNPAWPYIGVVIRTEAARSHNPLGRSAFATRQEAIDAAQAWIDRQAAAIGANLAEPRYRALREQYGLPRELPV